MAQIKTLKIRADGHWSEHETTDDVTFTSFTVTGNAASLSATGLAVSTATLTISGGNLQVTDTAHPIADTLVGASSSQLLANKSLVDASTHIVNSLDNSIAIEFSAGGSTGTKTTFSAAQTANRVLSLPNATDTLVGRATTDTLTNKSLSGASNTFSAIPNSATTAVSTNTANAIVTRDASGDFAANEISVDALIAAVGSGNGIRSSGSGSLEIAVNIGANMILVGGATSTTVIQGDLDVQGTTTSFDTDDLAITDNNITLNNGGNDASSEGAGLTVDRTGTEGSIVYKNASATRWAVGDIGAEDDVVGRTVAQSLSGKTIPVATNPITSTASRAAQFDGSGNLGVSAVTSTELGQLSGVGSQVDGISDTRTLTNKTLAVASNSITSTASRAAEFGAGGSLAPSAVTSAELGQLSGIGSQADGISDTRTLTNKTIATASNSITATASRAAQFSAGGNLEVSAVTTVELGYVAGVTSPIQDQLDAKGDGNPNDINEMTFASANNQSSPADVTGLAFDNGDVRAAKILLSVMVDATANLFEVFDMMVIQRDADWSLSVASNGDASGYAFTITALGQIQYTNGNYAGFVAAPIHFRAWALGV